MLDVLCCPLCQTSLRAGGPAVACEEGHRFPVTAGVPRLLPDQLDGTQTVRDSFTAEWAAFDYNDRTWGATVEQRREEFLRHVDLDPADLEGKTVLDAGCRVVAADISDQPVRAAVHFGSGPVQYVQADLTRPPFKPGAFDVVFCAGVLHHTPDTRETFDRLIPALAEGGTMFVWLYHHVPGRVLAVKSLIRRGLSRLPARVKAGVVGGVILPQAMLRQKLRPSSDERERLSWRERYVILLDSYTPRYRWEHTPDELAGWYREHGLEQVHTTEVGPWGFGVVARKPVYSWNSYAPMSGADPS
jgi:2-polyprenyl-3-methyl-5-hydroxy-6-metoxy-1,4-benzoquinol methylase